MMRGASLRSVAELLGHTSMKMTMRYAHLSPAFLSAEVSLLDPLKPQSADKPPSPSEPPSPAATKGKKTRRARKGQSESFESESRSPVPEFVKEIGSSGWTRTSNPPVNSLTSVCYLVGLQCFSSSLDHDVSWCSAADCSVIVQSPTHTDPRHADRHGSHTSRRRHVRHDCRGRPLNKRSTSTRLEAVGPAGTSRAP
jgi:hypothetical protein